MGPSRGAGLPPSASRAAIPGAGPDPIRSPDQSAQGLRVNDNRNLILAIALSLAVLLGWSFLSDQFFPTAEQPSTRSETGKQVPQQQPGSLPTATPETARTLRDRNLVLRETPRVAIESPSLRGSINLQGARIDDLVLTRHTETIARDSAPV